MRLIPIRKAQGFAIRSAPEDATITIVNYGEDGYTMDNSDFEKDAKELAGVLLDTLPSGTLDRLVIHLLTAKASQLKVAY